jgi:hypothetical protein
MKATEKLTLDQVRELINEKINKAIEDRNVQDFASKHAIRAGVIEAMFDLLVMNDPTKSAQALYLIDVKYILTKFKNDNDNEGTYVAEFYTESLCDEYLRQYRELDPEYVYVKSEKIIKR